MRNLHRWTPAERKPDFNLMIADSLDQSLSNEKDAEKNVISRFYSFDVDWIDLIFKLNLRKLTTVRVSSQLEKFFQSLMKINGDFLRIFDYVVVSQSIATKYVRQPTENLISFWLSIPIHFDAFPSSLRQAAGSMQSIFSTIIKHYLLWFST